MPVTVSLTDLIVKTSLVRFAIKMSQTCFGPQTLEISESFSVSHYVATCAYGSARVRKAM